MTAKPRQRYMPENKNTCFYKVWRVVDSKPFEIFIMATIVLNAIVLMVAVRYFWALYFQSMLPGQKFDVLNFGSRRTKNKAFNYGVLSQLTQRRSYETL